MSKVVDERVVEMQFDNKEFEKNISQSIASLEKLQESLKFTDTVSDIQNVSNQLERLNFDKLNKAADMIQRKFSIVGTVIDQVVRKITDKSFSAIGDIFNQIMSGGRSRAENMAKAKFNIRGIIGDDNPEELERIMKSIGDSVTNTAYSLDEAAIVASSLITSGIDGGEQLLKTLQGIAGAAAMSSSSFGDIGAIFAKIATRGRITGDEINQLSIRTINITELLAKRLGKTSAEISKMVSKGQIDFKTFAETIQEAYGEHAYKANETYAGSLANLRSALSRIGESVQDTKMKALTNVFNSLRPLVNLVNTELTDFKNILNACIMKASDFAVAILSNPIMNDIVSKAVKTATTLIYDLAVIIGYIGKGIRDAFGGANLQSISDFLDGTLNIAKNLLITSEQGWRLQRTFKGIFKILGSLVKIAWSFLKALKPVFRIVGMIADALLDVLAYMGDALSVLADSIEETKIFSKIVEGALSVLVPLAGVVLALVSRVVAGLAKAVAFLANLFAPIGEVIKGLGKEIVEVFANSSNIVEAFIKTLQLLAKRVATLFTSNKLIAGILRAFETTFGNIADYFKGGAMMISDFLNFMFSGKGLVIGFTAALIGLFVAINKVGGGIFGLLSSAKTLIKEITTSFAVNNLLKTSISVALLAGSIALLAHALKDIDTHKMLELSVIFAAIVGAIYMLGQISAGSKKAKSSKLETLAAITVIVASIVIIAKTLTELSQIGDLGKAVKALGVVAGALILAGIAASIMGKIPLNDNSVTTGVLELCLSLAALAYTLSKMENIKTEDLPKKIAAILAMIGIMSAIAIALAKMKHTGRAVIRPMIIMMLSMLTVSVTANALIKIMDKIKFDQLAKNLEKIKGLEGALLSLSALLASIGILANGLAPLVVAVGKSILSISLGMIAMSFAIERLGAAFEKNPASATAAVAAITVMSTMLVALHTLAIKDFLGSLPKDLEGLDKALKAFSKSILTVAVACAAVAGVAYLLSRIDDMDQFYRLEAALVTLGGIIYTMGHVASSIGMYKVDDNTVAALKQMTGMILIIAGLIGVFAVLDALELDYVTGVGAILLSLIVMFVGIAGELALLGKINITENTVKVLQSLSQIIMSLSIVLMVLSAIGAAGNWGAIIASAGGMALVIGSLAAVFAEIMMISNLRINHNTLTVIKLVSAAIFIILTLVAAISAIGNWAATAAATVGLALCIGSLVLVLKNMAAIANLTINKNTIETIKWITLAILGIGGIIALISVVGKDWTTITASAVAMAIVTVSLIALMQNIKVLESIKINNSVIKTIGILAACIGGIMLCITPLAALGDPGSIFTATFSLMLITTTLVGAATALSKFATTNIPGSVMGTIAVLAFSVSVMSGVLGDLAKSNPTKLKAATSSMMWLIGEMTVATIALEKLAKTSVPPTVIATFGVMALCTGLMALMVKPLMSVDLKGMKEAVAALSILIVLLTGSVIALSILAKNAAGALVGAVSVGLLSLMLIGLVDTLAVLASKPLDGIDKAMDAFAGVLIGLSLVVGILGALIVASEGLGFLGALGAVVVLSGLASGLVPLLDALGRIAEKDLKGIEVATEALGDVLLKLSVTVAAIAIVIGMNIAGAISGAISLAILATAMIPLVGTLSQLAQYDLESIKASVDAFTQVCISLGVLLAVLGGISSTGVGGVGLMTAAVAIVVVAESLSKLVTSMTGLGVVIDPLNQFIALCEKFPATAQNFVDGVTLVENGSKSGLESAMAYFDSFKETVIADMEAALAEVMRVGPQLGYWASEGYASGMNSGQLMIMQAAHDMVWAGIDTTMDTQDSHSESKVYRGIGVFAPMGLSSGMSSQEGLAMVRAGAETMVNAGIEEAGSSKNVAAMEAQGEKVGNAFGSSMFDTISDWLRKAENFMLDLADAEEDFVGLAVEKAQTKIGGDTKRYVNEQIKKVSEMYMSAGDEAKKAAMNVFGLDIDDEEGNIHTKTGTLGTIKDKVDDLTESFTKAGGAGGGAGKAIKESAEDIAIAIDTYDDLNKSLKSTIDGQMDLFSKFEKKTELSGAEIIENMRSQIEGVTEWADNLARLAARGTSKALLQELSKMGPQGYEKVNAFVNMTDEQLKEANELYTQRMLLPQAMSDYITDSFAEAGMWTGEGYITGLTPYVGKAEDTAKAVAEAAKAGIYGPLQISSPSAVMMQYGFWTGEGLRLGVLRSVPGVQTAMKKLGTVMINALKNTVSGTSLKGNAEDTFNSFDKGVSKSVPGMVKVVFDFCNTLITKMHEGLPDEEFFKMGSNIFTQLELGMDEAAKTLFEKVTTILNTVKSDFETEFVELGEYASEGLSKGIENKIKKISDSIIKVCKTTIAKAHETLEENSPSKVFFDMGENVTIGLANGIIAATAAPIESIDSVASTTISRFQNAINNINSMVEDSTGDMVITPILDTSNVESGLTRIGTMFDNTNVRLGASVDNVRVAGDAYARARALQVESTNEPVQQTVNNYTTFNQTNNSPKSLTNAEIYRQTNNLISRMK